VISVKPEEEEIPLDIDESIEIVNVLHEPPELSPIEKADALFE